MKKLFIIVVAAIAFLSCKENTLQYSIEGTIKGVTEGAVYLKKFRNKMYFDVDTAEIENGVFKFKGIVDQPEVYALSTSDLSRPLPFFLENAAIIVEIDTDNKSLAVENSPLNDLYIEIGEQVHTDGFNIDSLVSKYPDSPVAAFYLYRFFTYQLPLDDLKAIRGKLSESLNNSPYVKDLDLITARLENVQIGKQAPLFSLPDTAGVNVSLDSFKGKYTLVEFWASWCPYCRVENPNLVKAYNQYKNKNFTILSVSLDRDHSDWLKAIYTDGLTWTHVSDLKFWDSEIPALYGVRGIPANYMLDPEGVIVAFNLKGEDLFAFLSEHIK